MLPPTVSAETVERTWQALAEGRGLAAVLEGMVGAFGTSLSALPPFALISRGNRDDEVRVAVRGPIEVCLDGPAGSTNLSGLGVTTWNERAVAQVSSVKAGLPDAASPFLPINDGVVLASSIEFSPAVAAAPEPNRHPATAHQALVPAAGPDAAGGVDVGTEPQPHGGTEDPAEGTFQAAEDERPTAWADDDASSQAAGRADESKPPSLEEDSFKDPRTTGGATAAPGAAGEQEPSTFQEETLEDLQPTGQTTVAPTEEPIGAGSNAHTDLSAPEEQTALEEPPAGSYLDLLYGDTVKSTVEEAAVRAPQGHRHQPPDDAPQGLISGIPAFAAVTPASELDMPEAGDHDGETISLARLRAMQAAADPQASPRPAAPTGILPAATLIVSTGERFGLGRGAVIGRRPRLVRVQGGSVPQLVTVPSPNQDISRSHLELRVEGTHLLAVDLDTTNGTKLLRIGMDPVRLQPGEPAMLVSGDRIDIGDGIELSFEGLR